MRAKDVTSIDVLNLSAKSKKYYEERGISPQYLIYAARQMVGTLSEPTANMLNVDGRKCVISKEKMIELIDVLKDAELIRYDLTYGYYEVCRGGNRLIRKYSIVKPDLAECVDGFYNAIFGESYSCYYIWHRECGFYESFNEDYEEYVPIRIKDTAKLKGYLASKLLLKDYDTIMRIYGLESGEFRKLRKVANYYKVRVERIEEEEDRILGILKKDIDSFPLLEETILDGMLEKDWVPVKRDTDIRWAGFSRHTRDLMRACGIGKLRDIIDYPKEELLKSEILDDRARNEIFSRMELLSYGDSAFS